MVSEKELRKKGYGFYGVEDAKKDAKKEMLSEEKLNEVALGLISSNGGESGNTPTNKKEIKMACFSNYVDGYKILITCKKNDGEFIPGKYLPERFEKLVRKAPHTHIVEVKEYSITIMTPRGGYFVLCMRQQLECFEYMNYNHYNLGEHEIHIHIL